MIYYIADTHFHDERVMRMARRPFESVDEHDKALIERWNKKVKTDDTVYLLGDVSENNYPGILDILKSLNGKKHLIVGNHDLEMLDSFKESGVFESIEDIKFIKDNGRDVILIHYPLMDWRTIIKNSYLVYGHIHNKTEEQGSEYGEILRYYKGKPAYNAGVDVNNFEPVSLDELIRIKEAK